MSARVDLAAGRIDLARELGEQREQAVHAPARRLAQLDVGEKARATGPEQIAVGPLDALLGQDRADAVLERRAHAGERDAVAQQITQVAQLTRRDIGLRQQVAAQQVRERARVDRVGLHPRRGDRLGPERVREVQLVAGVLEQIGQPLPAVGRLQRDPALALDFGQQRQDRRPIVDEASRAQLAALIVEHCHVRALAMQVDADRMHAWASLRSRVDMHPER